MTTFKDVLCLMAIFIAYGIVGRLDYEDAVRLEQITAGTAACRMPDTTPPVREPGADQRSAPIHHRRTDAARR